MKKSERKILSRIYKYLNIPAPGSGTQSVTVKGLSGYSKDCQYVIPKIRQIIYAMGNGETWPSEIQEVLTELENWQIQRRNANWD